MGFINEILGSGKLGINPISHLFASLDRFNRINELIPQISANQSGMLIQQKFSKLEQGVIGQLKQLREKHHHGTHEKLLEDLWNTQFNDEDRDILTFLFDEAWNEARAKVISEAWVQEFLKYNQGQKSAGGDSTGVTHGINSHQLLEDINQTLQRVWELSADKTNISSSSINKVQKNVNTNYCYTEGNIDSYVNATIKHKLGGFKKIGAQGNIESSFLLEKKLGIGNDAYYVLYSGAIDSASKGTSLDFFLDKSKQREPGPGKPDHRKDIFDELIPVMQAEKDCKVKILFSYNITNTHWLTGEILLTKDGDKVSAVIQVHDPYGGGKLSEANFIIIKQALKQGIENAGLICKEIENVESVFSAPRQVKNDWGFGDGTSCGVIVADEIIKRIQGDSLALPQPYPIGAYTLRSEQLEYLREKLGNNDRVFQQFQEDVTMSGTSKAGKKETGAQNKQSENVAKSIEDKFTKDIDSLIEINNLIKLITVHQAGSLSKDDIGRLEQIGKLINDISWNENDHDCVRNKHGYRDRHKDKGNNKKKVGEEGAKLDFETLAHLKDLAQDEHYQWLLTKDSPLVISSLRILAEKVQFILVKEYPRLSEQQRTGIPSITKETTEIEHNGDLGFLRKVSAYYHDVRCVDKLLALLESMDDNYQSFTDEMGFLQGGALTTAYQNIVYDKLMPLLGALDKSIYKTLDLNNKVDRYWLGYFLVQLGETAKEISEFIKPEEDTKHSENNVVRFLFGKLGHYRQKIKSHPGMIYSNDGQDERLIDIKENLEAAKPNLLKFLHIVKELLSKDFSDITQKDYVGIGQILAEYNPQLINDLTAQLNLNPIIKRHGPSRAEKLMGIQNEIDTLQEAQKKHEERVEQLKVEKGNFVSAPSQASVSNEEVVKYLLTNKSAKQFKALLNDFIKTYSKLGLDLTSYTFSQLRIVLAERKQELNTQNQQATTDKASKKDLGQQLGKLTTLESCLTTIEKGLEKLNVNTGTLSLGELLGFYNQVASSDNTNKAEIEKELDGLKSKIAQKTQKIAELKKEKAKFLEKAEKESQDSAISTLKKISHEINNLISIEESGDVAKIDYARKMSIGFLGQYFKEVFRGEEHSEYIDQILKQDFLFLTSLGNAINTRHKSMHQVVQDSLSTNSSLKDTVFSDILPWQENIFALTCLLYDKLGKANQILNFLPKESLDSYTEQVKTLLVANAIVRSHIRLQNYSKAEEYFLKSKEDIDSAMKSSAKNTELGAGIYISYIQCLKLCGKTEQAEKMIAECFKIIGDKTKISEEIIEDLNAILLTINPTRCNEFQANSFKNSHNLLRLADAHLQYSDNTQEVARILAKVEQRLWDPSSDEYNSPITFYTWHHVYAKYYRVLNEKLLSDAAQHIKIGNALFLDLDQVFKNVTAEAKHLELCMSTILKHKEYFTTQSGTLSNNALLVIKVEQCANMVHIPYFIHTVASNKEQFGLNDKFKEAIKLANGAIDLYKQCSAETDKLTLAEVYLLKGIARFCLEGKSSDNAKTNFLLAKQTLEQIPESIRNSAKTSEVLDTLTKMFKEIGDNDSYLACAAMFKSNLHASHISSNQEMQMASIKKTMEGPDYWPDFTEEMFQDIVDQTQESKESDLIGNISNS